MQDRQTAFPGIMVSSLKLEKPPFSEPGVLKEYVGRGLIKEYDVLQLPEKFSQDDVMDVVRDAKDQFGPMYSNYRLKYGLKVRAIPNGDTALLQGLQDRSISTRSRAFVRAKNPFEPSMVDVGSPKKDKKLSGGEIGDVYDVTVTVTK